VAIHMHTDREEGDAARRLTTNNWKFDP